ncbi:MAG: polyprenyl synthetase family protein [Saprospiraceae bacterium]|nr:polyprenyl synthetase family protein [Saprospiraceae bacterium]
MKAVSELARSFNNYLTDYTFKLKPKSLNEPVEYIMGLGGKRIRPALVLAGYQLFKSDFEYANEAAMAVEVFHNFSLVHDDIMDEARLRRNEPTTHIHFNTNAAILSGDAMLILSYQLLEKYQNTNPELFHLFSKTAMEVCEGQAMDMDFERAKDVSIDEYVTMIGLKTSVLIACGMSMGAAIAGADKPLVDHLYAFGKNMGIAFQIQDDILDTFGKEAQVGKRIGGDILQKKKTYLYLKSLELLSEEQSARLRSLFNDFHEISEDDLINEVKSLYETAHVRIHAQELKLVYQQLALSHLDAVRQSGIDTSILKSFAEKLLDRDA